MSEMDYTKKETSLKVDEREGISSSLLQDKETFDVVITSKVPKSSIDVEWLLVLDLLFHPFMCSIHTLI